MSTKLGIIPVKMRASRVWQLMRESLDIEIKALRAKELEGLKAKGRDAKIAAIKEVRQRVQEIENNQAYDRLIKVKLDCEL